MTFSGGEATLRKDLVRLLQFASGMGLRNVLLTNGTRIDDALASAIVDTCFEIQISLDGFDSETNDPIRGKETFAAILSGLSSLATARSAAASRCRIALAITPLPQYLHGMKIGFPSFFAELNRLFGGDLLLRMTTDLKSGRNFAGLSPSEQREYRYRTRALKSVVQDDPDWDDKIDGERFAPNVRVLNCGFGQNISIQPDGDVFGCYDAKDEYMGNVTCAPLPEIYDNLQALFNSTLVQLSDQCRSCDLMFICGGGCRLHNKRFRGEYLAPYCCTADSQWKQSIYNLMAKKRSWSWLENNIQKGGAQ